MPTYAYRCPTGHKFDQFFRKISDGKPTAICPECGLVAERQLSGGGGLVFKGSGFYITDYGKDGKKGQATSPASSATGGGKEDRSIGERAGEGKSNEGRSGGDGAAKGGAAEPTTASPATSSSSSPAAPSAPATTPSSKPGPAKSE
jgi:putative FmdB family regulatory protein